MEAFFDNLNWVDVCVAALLLFSLIVGLIKGFFTQVAGIIGVLAAIVVALELGNTVASWMLDLGLTEDSSTAVIASFTLLFILTWGVWLVLSTFVRKAMQRMRFGGFDRALGGVFGLAKGALVAYVALALIDRFLPAEWNVNAEFQASLSRREGVTRFDSFLFEQRNRIPDGAWRVIETLRFEDAPAESDRERDSQPDPQPDPQADPQANPRSGSPAGVAPGTPSGDETPSTPSATQPEK